MSQNVTPANGRSFASNVQARISVNVNQVILTTNFLNLDAVHPRQRRSYVIRGIMAEYFVTSVPGDVGSVPDAVAFGGTRASVNRLKRDLARAAAERKPWRDEKLAMR